MAAVGYSRKSGDAWDESVDRRTWCCLSGYGLLIVWLLFWGGLWFALPLFAFVLPMTFLLALSPGGRQIASGRNVGFLTADGYTALWTGTLVFCVVLFLGLLVGYGVRSYVLTRQRGLITTRACWLALGAWVVLTGLPLVWWSKLAGRAGCVR